MHVYSHKGSVSPWFLENRGGALKSPEGLKASKSAKPNSMHAATFKPLKKYANIFKLHGAAWSSILPSKKSSRGSYTNCVPNAQMQNYRLVCPICVRREGQETSMGSTLQNPGGQLSGMRCRVGNSRGKLVSVAPVKYLRLRLNLPLLLRQGLLPCRP